MRLKHLTIFFAVLAAASLPRTAHAQDFDYDSYGVYDPYSNEISGYSITVDYMGYNVPLEADSDLWSPDYEIVSSSSSDDVGEAEADVFWISEQSGTYEIYGSHWYDGDGWNWLGDSYYAVEDELQPLVPTGEESWGFSQGRDVSALFDATILPSSVSFANRIVTENIALGDNCYFQGSLVSEVPPYSNSAWWGVGFSNEYGDDEIGLFGQGALDWVRYYEDLLNYNSHGSCNYGGTQLMYMDGVSTAYDTHSAGVGLSFEYVWVYRSQGSWEITNWQ